MQLREGERYPEGERAGREERFDFDALVRREVAARLYVQQPDTSDGLNAVEGGFSFCSAVAVSPIVPFCHRGALQVLPSRLLGACASAATATTFLQRAACLASRLIQMHGSVRVGLLCI